MVNPSFNIGQQIGAFEAKNMRENEARDIDSQDVNIIEQALEKAQAASDPKVLQDTIGTIISRVKSPERRKQAVDVIGMMLTNIDTKNKEALGRQAAKQGGYTYGAPAAVNVQEVKNLQPKQSVGGLTSQPIPPEVSSNIENVVQSSPDLNADDLTVEFDKAGIPRIYSNAFIENRRRQDEAKPEKEFAISRGKAISEYVNSALSKLDEAEDLKFTIGTARKAIQGDIATPGVTALIKNNPYSQILIGLTPDEASLQAANKKLLEGSKGIFGSKPTEREIFLLLNSMLPSIGKSKEANEAGLDFIEKINEIKIAHSQLVNKLTEGGTKYIPNIEQLVNEQMKPIGEAFRSELAESVNKDDLIKVTSPKGIPGTMTQKQIDFAKSKGVIFEPVKK